MQQQILRNVYWTFSRENYADARAFNDAVSRYNRELNADLGRPNDHWQPDSIVINAPACYIRYEAWFAEAPNYKPTNNSPPPIFWTNWATAITTKAKSLPALTPTTAQTSARSNSSTKHNNRWRTKTWATTCSLKALRWKRKHIKACPSMPSTAAAKKLCKI